MPTITATGSGRCEFGPNTACFISRQRARNNALSNLRAAAIRKCPNGYTITAGPTLTLTLDCDHQWNGLWPDVNSTYSVTATIVCNRSGQHPDFSIAQGLTFADSMQEAVAAWKSHYAAVKENYELLGTLTTTEGLLTYLEKTGAKKALEAVSQAQENGLISKIIAPSMQSLLERPLYGPVFYEIVNLEGIEAIKSFETRLDQAAGCPPEETSKPASDEGGTRTLNINISF